MFGFQNQNIVRMMKRMLVYLPVLAIILVSCRGQACQNIAILETTDIHGVILPYDFIEKKELKASLASVFTYVQQVRRENDITVLLDNGDNLQGQPEVYYYNFVDTASPHILSECMNFMGYDAGTLGNHDIEAGHMVYDRLVTACNFPLMAANAVSAASGEPYFKPYTIIKKNGVRIAVVGLITPSVPEWLPPALYSGIEFRDMVETARKWMPVILAEKPDLVVGLFHSGWGRYEHGGGEPFKDASSEVAFNVRGFDIIFTGHDHRSACSKFVNASGDTVLILNAGSRAEKVAEADIKISKGRHRGGRQKLITGRLVSSAGFKPDPGMVGMLGEQSRNVSAYIDRVIGNAPSTISSRDAFFGPSAFVDMIHALQLDISGADISFAAPLSLDVRIDKGKVTVGDMFKLYRYENMLYTMMLNGREIVRYLEYSCGEWFSTMKDSRGIMLRLRTDREGRPVISGGRAMLENPPYNFDSAAGIIYTVDLRKKAGERIKIQGLADGRPFEPDKEYKVALNSYRGSGGGGHLTRGAGLSHTELEKRLISSTSLDLRYYFIKDIESTGYVEAIPLNNWHLVPERWASEAKRREYPLLFGKGK